MLSKMGFEEVHLADSHHSRGDMDQLQSYQYSIADNLLQEPMAVAMPDPPR
jgi:hypothetical protein